MQLSPMKVTALGSGHKLECYRFSARHVEVAVEGDRDGARAVEARHRAGAGRQEPDPDSQRRLRAVPAGGARGG